MSRYTSTFAPLRHRDFRRLWASTFFATGGQWIQQATLGWVVYDLTGSASVLGAVLGMRAIPMLVLAPVSGIVADRFDRRYALATSQLLIILMSIALAVLLEMKLVEVWHLFVFSIMSGVSSVFDRTLRSTLVFHSVPRADAGQAVALNSIAFSVSRTVGPSVAGFLIAGVGAAWNFGVQALLYTCVVLAVLSLKAAPTIPVLVDRTSAWSDLKEGVRFVFGHPVARMMVVLGLVPPLLLIPSFSALMPVFAADVFKSGPEGLGLLLSAVGVGGVLGGMVSAWITRYDQSGFIQALALAVFAFSLIAFAASPNLTVAVVFLAIAGIAEMVHHTVHVTTLQMCAPEHMRGRIASLLPIFPAFISVGALLAGVLAELLGPEVVVILLALCAVAVLLIAWSRSPAVRNLRMSRLIARDEV